MASQAETQHSSMPTRLCELFEDVSALTHIHCWFHSVSPVGFWGVSENVWQRQFVKSCLSCNACVMLVLFVFFETLTIV